MLFRTSALVLMFASSLALADGVANTKGQSKENSDFESEGTLTLPELPDLWGIIRSITPENGRVRIEYETLTGFHDSRNNARQYNVSLETYVHLTDKETDSDGNLKEATALFPVEFRFGINATDASDFTVRDLRIGAMRHLDYTSGATIQVMSYVLKRYPQMFGTFHGGEIVSFTYKAATPVTSGSKLELVVKADVAFALGTTNRLQGSMKAAMQDAGNAVQSADYLPFTAHLPVAGSIGVRYAKSLLADLYGGGDFDANYAANESYKSGLENGLMWNTSKEFSGTSHLAHLYAGSGLRLQWKGFVVSGTLQRDWYLSTTYFNLTETKNKIVGLDTEYYWDKPAIEKKSGSSRNSDSGYTGMISVGYDW